MVGCTDCKNQESTWKVCRACELVDGDVREKDCKWCTMCSAYICQACEGNYFKRAQAFFKDKLEGK